MLDLTGQPQRITFTESPPEEMSYAEAFWHSVRLQPTMESRLVSSDIKQRLRKNKKANSKSSVTSGQPSHNSDNKLKEFFIRARTLEQMAEFDRLRRLSEARHEDIRMLHKRREERIKKEEISRDRVQSSRPLTSSVDDECFETDRKAGDTYSIEDMIADIDAFEKKKEAAKNKSPATVFMTTLNEKPED